MSDKKIVVPDGMLKAASKGDPLDAEELREPLRLALEWLSEHPIVPSEEDCRSLVIKKAGYDFEIWEWARWGASEWQRRMFLDPEPEIRAFVRNAFRGFTLTLEEAEYLKKEIDSMTHPGTTTVESGVDGKSVYQTPFPPNSSIYPQFFVDSWVPTEEIRLNGWDGPVLMKNIGNPDKENK